MSANPNWKTGMTALNPTGKGGFVKGDNSRQKMKHSVTTVQGMYERWFRRYYSPVKLTRMLNGQKDDFKLEFAKMFAPFVLPRKTAEGISTEEREKLESMLQEAIKSNSYEGKKAV